MKTFQEQFKDRIDMYHGTVTLTEYEYNQITSEAANERAAIAMGWTWAEACSRLDKGEDPRLVNCGDVWQKWASK